MSVVNRVPGRVDSGQTAGHAARLETVPRSESIMRWLLMTVCLASTLTAVGQAFPAADDTATPSELPDRYAQAVLRVEGML